MIATFAVNGFLDYVYFTNFEQADPALYAKSGGTGHAKAAKAATTATRQRMRKKVLRQWSKEGLSCISINFSEGDQIEGPLHTNDAASIVGAADVRAQRPRADRRRRNERRQLRRGLGMPEQRRHLLHGDELLGRRARPWKPPPNDTSLEFYVKPEYHFYGVTKIKLEGNDDERSLNERVEEKNRSPWPSNGLIYVQGSGSCGYAIRTGELRQLDGDLRREGLRQRLRAGLL